MTNLDGRVGTEARLQRIEQGISDLDRIPDPVARENVRELFEALLDLHGLALARISASVAKAANGAAILRELASDQQVRPVLLLHGLHPDDLRTRLSAALGTLHDQGVRVSLERLSGRSAIVHAASDAERHHIEATIFEAAPDLDTLELTIATAVTESAIAAA